MSDGNQNEVSRKCEGEIGGRQASDAPLRRMVVTGYTGGTETQGSTPPRG